MDRAQIFLDKTGCNRPSNQESLECAKRLSSEKILSVYNELDEFMIHQNKYETEIYLPVIDFDVYHKPIDELAAEKSFKQCNLLAGYNSDESAVFLIESYLVLGENEEEHAQEAQSFGYDRFYTELQKIFKFYPVYPYLSDTSFVNDIVSQYLSRSELQNVHSVNVNWVKLLSQITSDFQYVCQCYQIGKKKIFDGWT